MSVRPTISVGSTKVIVWHPHTGANRSQKCELVVNTLKDPAKKNNAINFMVAIAKDYACGLLTKEAMIEKKVSFAKQLHAKSNNDMKRPAAASVTTGDKKQPKKFKDTEMPKQPEPKKPTDSKNEPEPKTQKGHFTVPPLSSLMPPNTPFGF